MKRPPQEPTYHCSGYSGHTYGKFQAKIEITTIKSKIEVQILVEKSNNLRNITTQAVSLTSETEKYLQVLRLTILRHVTTDASRTVL